MPPHVFFRHCETFFLETFSLPNPFDSLTFLSLQGHPLGFLALLNYLVFLDKNLFPKTLWFRCFQPPGLPLWSFFGLRNRGKLSQKLFLSIFIRKFFCRNLFRSVEVVLVQIIRLASLFQTFFLKSSYAYKKIRI